MRKILLIVIIVILLAFGITAVFKGANIGSLSILSIKQIGEKSEKLDTKIDEVNNLINSSYPKKKDELNKARKDEQLVKEKYFDEINSMTDEEMDNTLKRKLFDIEEIWAKVGNYAIDAGVNIELTQTKKSSTGARNMHFKVTGTYVAQTNFLYLIEDDEELNYRIYDFKLVGEDQEILLGNFSIKDAIITTFPDEEGTSTQGGALGSLNDQLNGYENDDPQIKDPIVKDVINGKKENATVNSASPTPTPTPTPSATPTPTKQ